MPRVDLDGLPDHGKLWVFPASRTLAAEEADECLRVVDGFLAQWAAHGVPLRSARDLRESRFLLIGVDVDAEEPSGCSIDALVNRLRALGEEIGIELIDHTSIWFRDASGIRTMSRADFKALAREGAVTGDTVVFDTSLTTVGQARDGSLERRARETWHGRVFFNETRVAD